MYAITEHDRALIDQAIAAGAVRKIPTGVFGIDCATDKPYPSIEAAVAAHEATVNRSRSTGSAPQDERDRKIMECRRSGLSLRDTATKVGMALSNVHRRFRKMRPGTRW